MPKFADLPPLPLPDGITSRQVDTDTGMAQHVLESGDPSEPLLMLLHGFPEIAYSWRQVMPSLAEAGYWVVAPDLRGYGRTTGWENGYDCELQAFAMLNLVRDNIALIRALGRDTAHAMVGHDWGSPLTAWTALIRPEIAPRIVLMSAPHQGVPEIVRRWDPVHADMLKLDRPRKHYTRYYSERSANDDMIYASQGLHDFLRAYYHMKSGNWTSNTPHALEGWTATELAKLPKYYVMDAGETMAETVAHEMPGKAEIKACKWLSESDMAVYATEFARTGLQGGLNWYRCHTGETFRRDLSVFHGRKIEVPTTFLAGRQDWGWAQGPGLLDAMENEACADYRGSHLIDGAGHWVQQERPDEVLRLILDFLDKT